MRFARRFGLWFSGIIMFILTFYFFIPKANFKLMQVVVLSIQNILPSFTYWDLVIPIFVGYFIITFLVLFSKKKG